MRNPLSLKLFLVFSEVLVSQDRFFITGNKDREEVRRRSRTVDRTDADAVLQGCTHPYMAGLGYTHPYMAGLGYTTQGIHLSLHYPGYTPLPTPSIKDCSRPVPALKTVLGLSRH